MKKYAILLNPGHNRVYFGASLGLSVSEFSVVCKNLSTEYNDLTLQSIGGIEYLTFTAMNELTTSDIMIIYELSFVYALYEIAEIGGTFYLRPIDKPGTEFVDASIGTILKYTGKTNEIFTKMMLNVAFHTYQGKAAGNINLLDPVAGKGTTLFEGLVKGFNVYGIEIADELVNEAYHFTKRFLETGKYKFDHSLLRISGLTWPPGQFAKQTRGQNKTFRAQRHTFKTARTKEDAKNKNTRVIEFIAGNSLYADKYYSKNYFDIIVGDLPYGVRHGNITNKKQTTLTRNPLELLTACLPSWLTVLKKGGVIVLSWNVNVLRRCDIERLFAENGLQTKTDGPYLQFAHRVDQSILRDIIVATQQ